MRSPRLLIVLGLSLLALEFAAEAWLMLQHVDLAAMQASAPDEMLFIEKAPLQSGWSFLAGYGPPFWLLVKAIFEHLSFEVAVPLARGLFIAMKYASWLILFGILHRRDARAAALFLFVMLLTPGYFFFGKVISPEYMLLLLSALSLWCLHLDKGSFGAGHWAGLLFACLATATKVSAAPLLAVVYAASIVRPLWAQPDWNTAVRNGLKGACVIALFWLAMAWLSGPQKAWSQLSEALSIVPPTQFSPQVLREAWSRDAVTWDQIMVGGLGKDFLAACLLTLSVLTLALFWYRRTKEDDSLLAWLALLAGGLMLAQVCARQSAFAWYLFLPIQVLTFGACAVLASWAHARVTVLCATLVVLCIVAHDGHRIRHRLVHKAQNNALLTSATADVASLTAALKVAHPCAKLGHADILVPSASPSIMPMRTSLNHRTTNRWTAPDYILLNSRSMQAPEDSGLATLVEMNDFEHYVLDQRVGGLGLYLRRDLGC